MMRCLVVGGGVVGLACGVRLAQAGHFRVKVIPPVEPQPVKTFEGKKRTGSGYRGPVVKVEGEHSDVVAELMLNR